jgi:hypothetical protein
MPHVCCGMVAALIDHENRPYSGDGSAAKAAALS